MDKRDFVNRLYQAALAAGLSDAAARVTASQGGLESSYGESALAKEANNLFGIKAGKDWTGPTVVRPTKEVINGKTVTVNQRFRSYATPEEGIADRMAYMDDHFPGFSSAATKADALGALRTGKYGPHGNDGLYYTADQAKYEATVNKIDQTFLGGQQAAPPAADPGASDGLQIIDLTKGGKVGDQTIPANESTQLRSGDIKGIVFHHTGPGSLASALNAGTKHKGATYYIDTDGKVYQYAPDDIVRIGIRDPGDKYRTDVGKPTEALTNDDAISVEVVAPDSEHMTDAQRQSAAALSQHLMATHGTIDTNLIVGHGDIQGGAGGNKMPTEGVQIASFARDQLAANPAVAAISDATGNQPAPGTQVADAGQSGPSTTAPVPHMVKLASGEMILPGTYDANDGEHKLLVTDDGTGKASVKKVPNIGEIPGVIDPMHEDPNTIAGAYIQRFLQQAKEQAGAQAADTVNAVTGGAGDAAAQAVSGLTQSAPVQQAFADPGGTLGAIGANLGSFLTFGGAMLPKANTTAPAMNPTMNSSGSPDDRRMSLPRSPHPAAREPSMNVSGSPDDRSSPQQPEQPGMRGRGQPTPVKNASGSPDDRDLLAVLKDRAEKAAPKAGTPETNFNTTLSPEQESAYQAWKKQVAPNDSGNDYDFRGAFAAGIMPDPQTGHWPDTFKKPSEPTFSDQSQYAKYSPRLAGSWEGDTYIPRASSLEERDEKATKKTTPSYTTVQMEVDNPEYLKYIAEQNADPIGQGPGSFGDLQAFGSPTTSAPPPPKITITKKVPVASTKSSTPQRSGPTTFAPVVPIASGKMANVGARGSAQGGRYQYAVMPDGSVQELNSGRTTAPPLRQQQHSSNPSATYWDRSSGSWMNN